MYKDINSPYKKGRKEIVEGEIFFFSSLDFCASLEMILKQD